VGQEAMLPRLMSPGSVSELCGAFTGLNDPLTRGYVSTTGMSELGSATLLTEVDAFLQKAASEHWDARAKKGDTRHFKMIGAQKVTSGIDSVAAAWAAANPDKAILKGRAPLSSDEQQSYKRLCRTLAECHAIGHTLVRLLGHPDITPEEFTPTFGSMLRFDSERKVLLFAFGASPKTYTLNTQVTMSVMLCFLAGTEVWEELTPEQQRQMLVLVNDNKEADHDEVSTLSSSVYKGVQQHPDRGKWPAMREAYKPQYPEGMGREGKGSQAWHTDARYGCDMALNQAMLFVINLGHTAIEATQLAICEFRDADGNLVHMPWPVYEGGPVPIQHPIASARTVDLPQIQPGGFALIDPNTVHRGPDDSIVPT
jgi:hypothetical protein